MTSHSVTALGWYVVVEWPGPVARAAWSSPEGKIHRGDDIPRDVARAAIDAAYIGRRPLDSAILGAIQRGHVRTAAIIRASGYGHDAVSSRLPVLARRVRRGVWALRSEPSPQDQP